MPSTFVEEEHLMREFSAIRSFLNFIGSNDCTHIKIRKCGGDASNYINRKGYYSLNQVIYLYYTTNVIKSKFLQS